MLLPGAFYGAAATLTDGFIEYRRFHDNSELRMAFHADDGAVYRLVMLPLTGSGWPNVPYCTSTCPVNLATVPSFNYTDNAISANPWDWEAVLSGPVMTATAVPRDPPFPVYDTVWSPTPVTLSGIIYLRASTPGPRTGEMIPFQLSGLASARSVYEGFSPQVGASVLRIDFVPEASTFQLGAFGLALLWFYRSRVNVDPR